MLIRLSPMALPLMLALTGTFGSAVLLDTPNRTFTKHDKAYYADATLVNFVRPGLAIKIQSATISSNGSIHARFNVTDLVGLPLDLEGITTPGSISANFVAAYIPAGQRQYTAYTTHFVGPPTTTMNGNLPHADIGGTFQKLGDGQYEYTFATKLPANTNE